MSVYKFRRNIDIGTLDAENDSFLIKAFVDKNDVSLIENKDSNKSILLGRTGSGKSAIIKFLEENEEHICRIEPESMSLRHLSNSDIITYFKNLNIKLDLFYKVLWKHVFIVELIKLHYLNAEKARTFADWIKSQFPSKSKQKAIDYIEKWGTQFWESTEYRIKELESSLEQRFKTEFGGNLNIKDLIQVRSSEQDESSSAQKVKYEVISKAQKVVNESQIELINEIIQLMQNKIFSKTQKKYFIVIDDLDKEWVSNEIVYDLLKSLIDTIKDFIVIPNVKIVIALRTNIHKKIFKINNSRGIQREKYNHLYLELLWSKDQLKELLNNRLKVLMKETYTTKSPTIDEILPNGSKNQISGFEYILERTFMRPRDVIDYFNKCIKYGDGKTNISREIIRQAEDEYSHERLRALNDEWLENYGELFSIYGFLKNCNDGFKINEVKQIAEEFYLKIVSEDRIKNVCSDFQDLFLEFSNSFNCINLLESALIVMYEIGLIGIKITPDKKIDYIYNSYTSYERTDLTEDTKFYVHKMFHKALRIR